MKEKIIENNNYVLYDCNYYKLEDNTMGGIGYHSFYRPLCGDMYVGNELVTKQMQDDYRYFLKEKEQKEKEQKEKEDKKEKLEKINWAKKIVAENANKKLMTKDQAKKWKRNYNNVVNEGGDGYVPHIVTQEEYNYALSIINI
jgi:hypothetical protein